MAGLPADKTPWPPPALANVLKSMNEWDAWYVGDGDRLAQQYGAATPLFGSLDHFDAKPGLLTRMARWFWGQPATGQYRTKLHVPIAADICQAGADLLYAEPPTLTVDADTNPDGSSSTATQDRLNEHADDTLHGILAESTEIGGALGGSYLRVTWDRAIVPDRPFLTAVHADAAWPEFRWGRLSAVTFWRVVLRDDKDVYRHVERHELDTNRVGVILHGLYKGDDGNLGKKIDLGAVPATAGLVGEVDDTGMVSTESPGLAVAYTPNMRPQRKWRKDPVGYYLGRSHLDGIEHLMDSLDETYSSWMRDIRIGKGRVFVAKDALRDLGAGKGSTFDADQEIYAQISAPPSSGQAAQALPILPQQFKIRVEEHQGTANQLVEDILRTAGFSSQTFGMDNDAARASNLTATEVQSRERRSYMTRDRMIRLARPQAAAILEKLLWVDKAIFKTPGIVPQAPNVAFADAVQESTLTLAQTASALSAAKAASTQTLVQLIHPDWDDRQVQAEVKLIHAEDAAASPTLPDPFGQQPPTDPTP